MRELLFRGQQRKKGEKVRLDGSPVESSWFYGNGVFQSKGDFSIIYQSEPEFSKHSVYSDTLGQYTGLTDKNGVKIFEGDVVKILDYQMGIITNECATFGAWIKPYVDWDYLDSAIYTITGCDNNPYFCRNDNFVSLWECMWNYNQEDNDCFVVEVIGNIHDNPELSEGGEINA